MNHFNLQKFLWIFLIVFSISNTIYGRKIYVSVVDGHDKYDGFEATFKKGHGPIKSLKKAAEILRSGDSLILRKGSYLDQLYLYEKHNITILAFGDGQVILMNIYDQPLNWNSLPGKSGIVAAKIPSVGMDINRKLPEWYAKFNYIFSSDGSPLYGLIDKNDFLTKRLSNSFVFFGDSVYISKPKKEKDFYDITKSGSMINAIGCSHLKIDGGNKKLIQIKYGGRYAIALEGNCNNLSIKNVVFSDCSTGVYLYNVSGQGIIGHCKFESTDVSKNYIWQDIKASQLETTAIAYASGSMQLKIDHCSFTNVFNGVMSEPGFTEIAFNDFTNIGDDAIELDGPSIQSSVHDNILKDCFTAFSLCPVEVGPVYIYNNLITSSVLDYDFERLRDGQMRKVSPKTLKFWNLPNGKTNKDGVRQNVSGNVYFYYNTVKSIEEPFSIGAYGTKSVSPVNAKFYNNVFYSDGVITNSTGFKADGIDIDNNVFFTSFKNKKESRVFIGWDGNNHYSALPNDKDWSDNKFLSLKWKKNSFLFEKKTEKVLLKNYKPKLLSSEFLNNTELNKRKLPGCELETVRMKHI